MNKSFKNGEFVYYETEEFWGNGKVIEDRGNVVDVSFVTVNGIIDMECKKENISLPNI